MNLRDLVCSPDGKLAEAKLWSNVFKGTTLWLGIANAEALFKDWMLLGVWLLAGIAPDVVKKIIVTRAGGQEKKE